MSSFATYLRLDAAVAVRHARLHEGDDLVLLALADEQVVELARHSLRLLHERLLREVLKINQSNGAGKNDVRVVATKRSRS